MSTVQGIIKKHNKQAKVENEELRELPRKDRGAKTPLPTELEYKVWQIIKNMGQDGCVINYNIVIAIAKVIVSTATLRLL